jgi:hypothetical protein
MLLDKTLLEKTLLDETLLDKMLLDKTSLDKTSLDKTLLNVISLDKWTLYQIWKTTQMSIFSGQRLWPLQVAGPT